MSPGEVGVRRPWRFGQKIPQREGFLIRFLVLGNRDERLAEQNYSNHLLHRNTFGMTGKSTSICGQ